MGSVRHAATAGAARGEMCWLDGGTLFSGPQNVEAEASTAVQPLDLDQTASAGSGDCCIPPYCCRSNELHAVPSCPPISSRFSPKLSARCLTSSPRLICAVGGAEHAAGALQTVDRAARSDSDLQR